MGRPRRSFCQGFLLPYPSRAPSEARRPSAQGGGGRGTFQNKTLKLSNPYFLDVRYTSEGEHPHSSQPRLGFIFFEVRVFGCLLGQQAGLNVSQTVTVFIIADDFSSEVLSCSEKSFGGYRALICCCGADQEELH